MRKLLSLILATLMCLTMMSTVFAAEFKFTDVKESDWFYNDVKNAVEMGLINGKSETEYKPNDNLTYAEAIKLAACMNQLYMDGVITLKNGDPWYQTYVDYCVENGIIDKYYDYDEKATRAGYAVIFANALPDEALAKINSVADGSIPDVPETRAYAPEVYKLYRAGILQGSDDARSFKPLDNILRSEVAAILSRMMDETKRVKFTLGEEEQPEENEPEENEPEEKEPEEKEPETTAPLAIKTQPAAITVNVGETVELKVEVEGGKAPYTYQWQKTVTITKSVTSDFVDEEGKYEGAKTDTFKITLASAGSIEAISCKITDADGASVTTETVTVTFKEKSTGGIKDKFEQVEKEELKNEDFAMTIDGVYNVENRGIVLTGYVSAGKVNVGDTVYLNDADGKYVATTTVKAIEMFNKILDESKKGDKPGINVDLDVETYKAMALNGYVLSATKGSSSLGTRPSTGRPSTGVSRPLPVETKPLTITSQPKDSSGSVGIFRLDVAVEGGKAPYTYQWQRYVTITVGNRKTSKYTDMVNSEGTVKGATTANLLISVTELGTYKYKCVITDADGNSVTSDAATVTVNSESTGGRVSIPSSGKTDY